ncbi:phage portal protein, partial [Acetomicrobium sp. S15 = DSM 107314]|uniref:phage portal protein n=1 Tax=Acetomicrobium sp. S15 = DSM 107314 TaxID=2529858 RepID=UPI0018E13B98
LAPVIEDLKQLDRYTEAELMAAVVGGLLTVFITQQAPGEPPFGDEPLYDDSHAIELGHGPVISWSQGEKPEIFIGAYQSKVYDGRACSLPNVDPTTYINYDNAKAACNAKGG